jgi:rhodanese-related sulfurtransferase
MDDLPRRTDEIDWSREVVFVCRSGKRSQLIAGMAAAGGGRGSASSQSKLRTNSFFIDNSSNKHQPT